MYTFALSRHTPEDLATRGAPGTSTHPHQYLRTLETAQILEEANSHCNDTKFWQCPVHIREFPLIIWDCSELVMGFLTRSVMGPHQVRISHHRTCIPAPRASLAHPLHILHTVQCTVTIMIVLQTTHRENIQHRCISVQACTSSMPMHLSKLLPRGSSRRPINMMHAPYL